MWCYSGAKAMLIIHLLTAVFYYSINFIEPQLLPLVYATTVDNVVYIFSLCYPLYGWLANARIGRYRAIVYSMVLMSIGCVAMGAALITHEVASKFEHPVITCIVLVSILFTRIGAGVFSATVLPFIIDQMIGASGNQLSTAINLLYGSRLLVVAALQCLFYVSFSRLKLVFVLIGTFSLTAAFSGIFLCQHHLDKEPHITNPIRDIDSVLNYARKNKCPRNRSALTYWENRTPS